MGTTAETIITTALQKLMVVPPGGSPTAGQLSMGLVDLNDLLRSWRQYGLTTWARRSVIFTLTSGKGSYTIGVGGDANTTRPVALLPGTYLSPTGSGVGDVPLTLISKTDFQTLANKAQTGQPTQLWYDAQLTRRNPDLGTLYFWPVPNTSGMTVTLDAHIPITDMVGTDIVDIPDEWLQAMKFNLAVHLAPGTGRNTPQDVLALAQRSFEEALSSSTETGGSIFLEPDRW